MKTFFKKIALLLASCMLVSCCTACNGGGENENNSDYPNAVSPVTQTVLPNVEGTVHQYNITETEEYIVKNGASDYRILIPAGTAGDKYVKSATNDLRDLFYEATGVSLSVIEDNADLSGGKFLAIGDTKLASAKSLGATLQTLGRGGFVIKTVGNSVCMAGANSESSMYAVYAFLEQTLGFEHFFTDFYALNKEVKNLKLCNYDVVDIPDFEYRIQSTGYIRWNDENIRRMRWTDGGDNNSGLFIPADPNDVNTIWHNTFTYLPPSEYKEVNPEWYCTPWRSEETSGITSANQLCYTARGEKDKYALMVDTVAHKLETLFAMEEFKDLEWITVSIQDNQNCCSCNACKAEKAKYGVDSAVIVKFLNDVAEQVETWMQTEEGKPHYRKDFRIFFFAYHATNASPTKYDKETDSFLPIDDSVKCNEHVVPYFAETNGDYTQNFHDEGTANTQIGKNMRGWRALSNEIYFWSYSTNFNHFLTPYNSFDSVQDILKFAKNNDTKFVMIQDQWIQKNAETGFGIFKNWLHSKLLWNVNADVNALTKEFFDGYFVDASETMLTLFNSYRAWANHQTQELGYKGYRSVYYNALKEELWPHRILTSWIDMTNQAQKEIEVYKTKDPILYSAVSKNIACESLAFRYILLKLYVDQYSEADALQMKKDFSYDISRSGMNLVSSMGKQPVSALLSNWGV